MTNNCFYAFNEVLLGWPNKGISIDVFVQSEKDVHARLFNLYSTKSRQMALPNVKGDKYILVRAELNISILCPKMDQLLYFLKA